VLEAGVDPDLMDVVVDARHRNQKSLLIRLGPAKLGLGLAAMAVHHPGIRSFDDLTFAYLLRFPGVLGRLFQTVLAPEKPLVSLDRQLLVQGTFEDLCATIFEVAKFVPDFRLGVEILGSDSISAILARASNPAFVSPPEHISVHNCKFFVSAMLAMVGHAEHRKFSNFVFNAILLGDSPRRSSQNKRRQHLAT
jgi:hypothetical protein